MDIDSLLNENKSSIIELSKEIYNLAEPGSREYKSSGLIMDKLRENGFTITNPYMNMKTAFRAEYGVGTPVVGLLTEYDALPNGHSCGHNLIAAWSYGTAVILKSLIKNGKIVVFGTPSEEGIGDYAGSKAVMAANNAFNNVDFVIGMHPDDRWAVGSKALADAEIEFTFKGIASHMAASPDYGINALDALVTSYVAINNMRDSVKNDKHAVIGMIIKEGGKASNIIPDRTVLEVDIRSTSSEFLLPFVDKIKNLVKSVSDGFGTTLNIRDLMPVYTEYKFNKTIDSILYSELEKLNIKPLNIDENDEIASSSTDEANVSIKVPVGHIDMKIGTNLPGHSDEFRDAADPENNVSRLLITVKAAVNTILYIMENGNILKKIKSEFDNYE